MQLLKAIWIAWDFFELSFLIRIKQGEVSKTDPSEIGFPMTLTSGAFLNQKTNKQTNHE